MTQLALFDVPRPRTRPRIRTVSDHPIRGIPEDPDGDMVARMFDVGGEWIMTAPGDYHTCAAEAFKNDGSGYQRVVILEWPGRWNHTDKTTTVRLMISPEDAIGLADVLTHTARWLLEQDDEDA